MAKFQLRPDQMEDLVTITVNRKHMLLNDPGTGKTPTTIVNMWRRWSQNKLRTVWVMPKSLMRKNVKEVLRFSDFQPEDIVVVDGTPKQVDKQLASDAKILIMGPDRFRLISKRIKPYYRAIDVDEFHMCFGGATSKRTLAYLDYVKDCEENVVMSGTLINGRLDTAWPAIHGIEPKYYPFGIDQFLNYHAVLDDYGKPLYWRNHERLGQILIKHGVRRTFASIFGDQAPLIQVEDCNLSPTQKALFEEFEEKAIIELERTMIEGVNPGVALIRARQILDHPQQFPDPDFPGQFMDLMGGEVNGKQDLLAVHLEDHIRAGTPFVVFSTLVPQQMAILKQIREAGIPVGSIIANDSAKKRSETDEAFCAGKIQCIVASTPIANAGFNWQFWGPDRIEVPHCIHMSLPYLDGDFIQANQRFIREERRQQLRVTVPSYDTEVCNRMMAILEMKSKDANKVDPTRQVLKFAA